MIREWYVTDESMLHEVASEVIDSIQPKRQQIGVEESVQSPTFSIVHEYRCGNNEPVYHFDFYRLKNAEGALDLGYEEYLYSGYFCFIEWPGQVAGLEWPPYAELAISHDGEGRKISLKHE
jgi:tRNA threonylcarbamoyladenosine biosynthesis protein TsaE